MGVSVMAYAGLGTYLSDRAEEKFGLKATEQDKEELKKSLPKITLVDKER
jgi:hypothetical protein